jgi:eukaryotic-like serine/threonine-protein kinase
MVGASVGPYRVLEKIGAGGMGEVFLAEDPRLKRRVALKCLAIRAGDDDRTRITNEARAIARLNHSNIAAVYDIQKHEGRWFIVMEYAEGISLRERMAQGRLPLGDVLTIGRQLASALAAAHRQRVIHRDLKPANIHVTGDGLVKVLDFGVAFLERQTAGSELPTTSIGTPIPTFRIVGTPAYMAPEQHGGRVSKQSDIYSLGVILFEMVTGRRPISSEPAPSATSIEPSVPSGLSDVIAKALEHDLTKRFGSASEIERALTGLIDAPGAGSSSNSRVSRARWGVGVAAAAIIVSIAASASWPSLITDMVGRPGNPTVLAVLPPANPSGDPVVEQFGLAVATLVSRNFRAAPDLKIVTGEAISPYATARADLAPLGRDVGASYVLDLTIRAVTPSVDVLARLRRPDAGVPEWEKSITGDAIEVENLLLHQLADALGRQGSPRSTAEQTALTRLPTVHGDALLAYVQSRALLEHKEVTGNPRRAADLLEQAISSDDRFALAHAALADALRARSTAERDSTLLDRATLEAKRALELDPEESGAHTAFAAIEYVSGRREAATTSVQRAVDLAPDNDEARRLLGQILAAQGRVDEGVAQLQTAIRIRPASFNHYFTLGFIQFTASRYAAAVDAYRKAAEIRPGDPGSYEMLGATYQMLGDMDKAIGNYEHALRLGPSVTAHANLAVAYFTAGEYDKARTALIAAIEWDPKKASLHRDLGDVYLKLKRQDDARTAYGRAIALSEAALAVKPGDPFSIVLIALCEANLGRRSRAERHASEAMALAPANRDVLFRSAKVFALSGSRPAALNALRRAVEQGYDREVARLDPELATLRSMPEFGSALSAVPLNSR